jgi:hypothetical protein
MSALDRAGRLKARWGPGRIAIASLERRPSPYASSCALEEIDVVLADGSEAALVMKDLSPAAMDASARRARPAFLYEPRREIQTYRHILPHAPPGAAACYGVVVSPSAHRYRLLLERVDGHELRHVGAFSMWERTAQWIARFHAAAPASPVDRRDRLDRLERLGRPDQLDRLARRATLLVYDDVFYWQWLERAREFASRSHSRLRSRQRGAEPRRVLDGIARRYASVVARLTAMPRTVIHGEFYPCNILIRGTGPRARVCPVDWELTAIGPGLIDLAALMTGWDDRAQRALARAYRDAARETQAQETKTRQERPLPVSINGGRSSRDFQADLDCCRLHLAVRMLGWSESWTPPPQHARDWLGEAASLADRIQP